MKYKIDQKKMESFEQVLFHPKIDVNIQPIVDTLRVLWNDMFEENASENKDALGGTK